MNKKKIVYHAIRFLFIGRKEVKSTSDHDQHPSQRLFLTWQLHQTLRSAHALCLEPRLKEIHHKAQMFLSVLCVSGRRPDSVFSVGFRVPFGIGMAWEVKGRMAASALSATLVHQVPGAGARLAPLAAGAKNNPAAVVGQERE